MYMGLPVRNNAALTAPFIPCGLLHAQLFLRSGPLKDERAHVYILFFSG